MGPQIRRRTTARKQKGGEDGREIIREGRFAGLLPKDDGFVTLRCPVQNAIMNVPPPPKPTVAFPQQNIQYVGSPTNPVPIPPPRTNGSLSQKDAAALTGYPISDTASTSFFPQIRGATGGVRRAKKPVKKAASKTTKPVKAKPTARRTTKKAKPAAKPKRRA
jgi:hypothetical protein